VRSYFVCSRLIAFYSWTESRGCSLFVPLAYHGDSLSTEISRNQKELSTKLTIVTSNALQLLGNYIYMLPIKKSKKEKRGLWTSIIKGTRPHTFPELSSSPADAHNQNGDAHSIQCCGAMRQDLTNLHATFMFLPSWNKNMTISPYASLYRIFSHISKFLGSTPLRQPINAEVPFWNTIQTPFPNTLGICTS